MFWRETWMACAQFLVRLKASKQAKQIGRQKQTNKQTKQANPASEQANEASKPRKQRRLASRQRSKQLPPNMRLFCLTKTSKLQHARLRGLPGRGRQLPSASGCIRRA